MRVPPTPRTRCRSLSALYRLRKYSNLDHSRACLMRFAKSDKTTKPIGRRQLLGLAGSVALWPRALRAQQPMPAIGFLLAGSVANTRPELAAFWQGIGAAGF